MCTKRKEKLQNILQFSFTLRSLSSSFSEYSKHLFQPIAVPASCPSVNLNIQFYSSTETNEKKPRLMKASESEFSFLYFIFSLPIVTMSVSSLPLKKLLRVDRCCILTNLHVIKVKQASNAFKGVRPCDASPHKGC